MTEASRVVSTASALTSPCEKEVYYSAAAQEDNLGDVIIRRTVLQWIASAVEGVHVLRGGMSDSYISALAAPVGVTFHDSWGSFSRSWLRSCWHRRAAVVYAPGPRVATSTAASAKSAGVMLTMTGMTRSTLGPALAIGGAIRGRPSLALRLHRTNASICTDYSVRDSISRNRLLGGARLIPDVAFAESSPLETVPNDPTLIISMRFDARVDAVALRSLIRQAKREAIRPVILTQVRRDQPGHELGASELGVEICGWTDQSHAEQLERVDLLYRRSVAVFSDRLHACVFGARHGGLILNAEGRGSDKIVSTLSTVYPEDAVRPYYTGSSYATLVENLDARRATQSGFTRRAAEYLESERIRITSLLRDPSMALKGGSNWEPPGLFCESSHSRAD